MLNLCLPMKVINITQHSGGSYSHPNNSLDLAGSDSGIDFAFALGNFWKCISGPWGSNTYFYTPCDERGNAVQIHCADNVNRYVTVAMTHSNLIYNKPIIGKIYSDGQAMYEEGTYGKATGNHIHYEVAEGLQYSKYLDNNLGVYRMKNELKPEEVCFICDSFSKVKNMGGVSMRHCTSPYYEGGVKISLKGIDISNWQSSINLANIDADFVIVKASEGVGWTDPSFTKLFNSAKALNKKLGLYHFARPTVNNTAEQEANTFVSAAKSVGAIGKAMLVLDWEAENKTNVSYAKKWLDTVYNLTGVKPVIYMSESVTKQADWSSVVNAGYALWVAKYRDNEIDYNYDMSNAGTIPNVSYWPKYIMWQWTGKGRLNGYSGDLDCNIFYGNENTWNLYSKSEQKQEKESNELDKYSDEELAHMVIDGKFGSGEERKKALGDRYTAVQTLVNEILANKDLVSTNMVDNYTVSFNGYTVYVGRVSKKADMRASVIGKAPGAQGDKMSSQYFADEQLLNKGYSEATAQNASTFYSWNGATYAEGIEISQGENHQDFSMNAVSTFNTAMAVGFPYTGGMWFGPQSEIIANYKLMYGAVTSGFGIIYGGKKNFMGSSLPRNGIFNAVSGRSILAEDDYYWYSICFYGNTGSTGLTGIQLYDLCIKISPNMTNAMCFDGGGSVFQRVNGNFNINTSRLVKNAVLMYVKEKEEKVDPLAQYTDEELAKMVIEGKFGNSDERKAALGDRYEAVQKLVNELLNPKEKTLAIGVKVNFLDGAWNLDTGEDYIKLDVATTVENIKNRRIETTVGPVAKEFIELI